MKGKSHEGKESVAKEAKEESKASPFRKGKPVTRKPMRGGYRK